MGFIQEFKDFAVKGNVVDMAVGIIIGGAFGKIVTSFVNDVVMPPIGALLGGTNFSSLQIIVKEAVGETPAVAIKYGAFLNTVIDFVIIVFTIFVLIKAMNNLKKKEEAPTPAAPAPTPEDIMLLREIRDSLKK